VQILVVKWHQPSAKQFDACATVHCPFECLESVDLALGLTVTPGIEDRIPDGIDILA
jgi:hypothetical protein